MDRFARAQNRIVPSTQKMMMASKMSPAERRVLRCELRPTPTVRRSEAHQQSHWQAKSNYGVADRAQQTPLFANQPHGTDEPLRLPVSFTVALSATDPSLSVASKSRPVEFRCEGSVFLVGRWRIPNLTADFSASRIGHVRI